MTTRLKYLQFDAMGGFFDFQRGWWDKDTRQQTIDRFTPVLDRFANKGIRDVNYFAAMVDNTWHNAHYRHLSPWPRSDKAGRPFDLSQIRNKWLRSFEAWNQLLKDTRHRPVRCDYMWGYTFLPFEYNVNSVEGFETAEGFQFQVEFGKALNAVEREVFGPSYRVKARPINECRHGSGPGGSDEMLHFWMNWHADYYREALASHVRLRDLFVDSHGSEGAHAAFVPPHPCGKCGRTLGSTEFLNPEGRVQVNIVNHSYSIPEDVGYGFYKCVKSPTYRPPATFWCGGDGGAHDLAKARGYQLIREDTGRVVWAQGDKQQSKKLVKKILREGGRFGHRVGYQITCFETLRGWPWIEHFSMDTIDWARINGFVNGYKLALGK